MSKMFKVLLRVCLVLACAFASQNLFAQGKETAVWFTGENRYIDFKETPPNVHVGPFDRVVIHQKIVIGSVCDPNGNLLYYSDGIDVYSSDGNPILNSRTLSANHPNTSPLDRQVIFIQNPETPSRYYVILAWQRINGSVFESKMCYVELDRSLDGGRGAIVQGHHYLFQGGFLQSPAFAVVDGPDASTKWLLLTQVTHTSTPGLDRVSAFMAAKITGTEIDGNDVEITTTNALINYFCPVFHSMRPSMQGDKIAIMVGDTSQVVNSRHIPERTVAVFSFNKQTGRFGITPQLYKTHINDKAITSNLDFGSPLFSPNGRFLYSYGNSASYLDEATSNFRKKLDLLQFDLNSYTGPGTFAAPKVLYTYDIPIDSAAEFGVMTAQQGLDGKIYTTSQASWFFNKGFSVIDCPNALYDPEAPIWQNRLPVFTYPVNNVYRGRQIMPVIEESIMQASGVLEASTSRQGVCAGDTIRLFSNAIGVDPGTISWSPPNNLSNPNAANPVFYPPAAGSYTYIVSAAYCSGRLADTLRFTINNALRPVLGPDTLVTTGCFPNIRLRSLSNFPEGTVYNWQPGNGTESTYLATETGTYILTTNYGGCIGSDTIKITEQDLPLMMGNTLRSICTDTVAIARFTPPGLVHQSVFVAGAGRIDLQTNTVVRLSNLRPGRNVLRNTFYRANSPACTFIAFDTVYRDTLPQPQIPTLIFACQGDTAMAGVPNYANSNIRHVWSTGDTGKIFRSVTPGEYSLTLTNGACSKVYNFRVTIYWLPQNAAGPDTIICKPDTIRLGYPPSDISEYTYKWHSLSNPEIIIADSTSPYPLIPLPDQINQTYLFTLTSELPYTGCKNTDTISVKVVSPANASTGLRLRSLCSGATDTLGIKNADNTQHYVWLGPGTTLADTLARLPINPVNTGIEPDTFRYILRATGKFCTASDTAYVRVLPKVKGTLYGPAAVCPAETQVQFFLDDTLNNRYTWTVESGASLDSGQGTNRIYTSWDTTRRREVKIKVIATSVYGCVDSMIIRPVIKTQIAPAAPRGDTGMCHNLLTASYVAHPHAGSTYNWTLGAGSQANLLTYGPQGDSATIQFTAASPDTLLLYYTELVITTDTICIGNSAPIHIIRHPVPDSALHITPITPPCLGSTETYSLAGMPDSKYYWNLPDTAGIIIPLAQNIYGSSIMVNWLRPGRHTLQVQEISAYGCAGPVIKHEVKILPPVSILGFSINADTIYQCRTTPDSIRFTASPGYFNYKWKAESTSSIPPGLSDTTNRSIAARVHDNVTTFKITATDSLGCTHTKALTIVINATPVADAGTIKIACFDEATVQIGAEDPFADPTIQYNWSPAEWLESSNKKTTVVRFTRGASFTRDTLLNFRLLLTNPLTGCIDSAQTSVFFPAPIPVYDPDPDDLIRGTCGGYGKLQLPALSDTTGSVEFLWTDSTFMSPGDSRKPRPTISPRNTSQAIVYKNYPVTLSKWYTLPNGEKYKCERKTDYGIMIYPELNPRINAEQTICLKAGQTAAGLAEAQLTFGTSTYEWYLNGKKKAAGSRLTYDSLGINRIWYVETSLGGCRAVSDTLSINVVPAAATNLTYTGDSTVCAGVNINFGFTGLPAGSGTVFRTISATTVVQVNQQGNTGMASAVFAKPGSYIYGVTEITKDGCAGREQVVNFTVPDLPAPVITGPSILCFDNLTDIFYKAEGLPGSAFTWSLTGDISSKSSGNDIYVTWDKVTRPMPKISLTEITARGCTLQSQTREIRIDSTFSNVPMNESPCILNDYPLLIPNVFTPNGDILNDAFIIKNRWVYAPVKTDIFNRWGNRVFHSDDYRDNWTAEGLPAGTYYYIIQSDKFKSHYKGYVEVLR
ncbi:MAG: gliding motility-associated C-terminal domain-containing protein [Bacteroidota bacterium]